MNHSACGGQNTMCTQAATHLEEEQQQQPNKYANKQTKSCYERTVLLHAGANFLLKVFPLPHETKILLAVGVRDRDRERK